MTPGRGEPTLRQVTFEMRGTLNEHNQPAAYCGQGCTEGLTVSVLLDQTCPDSTQLTLVSFSSQRTEFQS